MLPDALYEPDGDTLVPTQLTRGPWSDEHQHAGPPSALLSREIERAAAISGGQTTRITLDILRPVPIAPLRVLASVLRPGRRVEQLEAVLTLASDGTELMRARAWRMRAEDVALPGSLGTPDPPPPAPDALPESPRAHFFSPGAAYVDGLEWRFFAGSWSESGPAGCWTRMRAPLVAGEETTPLQHLLVMADAASGISAALDWSTWTFLNVDFSLALERPPAGEWLAMDAVTRPASRGAGVCTAVLSDATGRIGTSSQALLVAPR